MFGLVGDLESLSVCDTLEAVCEALFPITTFSVPFKSMLHLNHLALPLVYGIYLWII